MSSWIVREGEEEEIGMGKIMLMVLDVSGSLWFRGRSMQGIFSVNSLRAVEICLVQQIMMVRALFSTHTPPRQGV